MRGVQTLRRAAYKSILYLKRGSPTILSCVGAVGVIATTASAIKATPKALTIVHHESRMNHDGDPYAYTTMEAVKSAWKCYIPTAIIGLSTIACIFGANSLNKKQQAAITSAYMLLDNAYKEYKKKSNAMFGENTDSLVRKAIMHDKMTESSIPTSDEVQLFYEYHYGDFFERSKEEILSAEYRFNMIFASRGCATLNEFYELLNLPKLDIGDALGWSVGRNIGACQWVDFEHEFVELEDGMECFIINMTTPPSIDYL